MTEERITVLLGAGACLELKSRDDFWPSTENITNAILNTRLETMDSGDTMREVTLLKDIYVRACERYHPALDSTNQHSASKVHFEILFYLLEILETYERSWRATTSPKHTNMFAAFVDRGYDFNAGDVYVAYRHLIEMIIQSVKKYDDVFGDAGNDWYRDFWRQNGDGWDLFNLNYDTTLEQSLESYEDGYDDIAEQEDFQRFNIKKLAENKNGLSTINHIHGCLLYGKDRYNRENLNLDVYDYDNQDMYKWPDTNIAYEKWQGIISSSETAQDGSVVMQGPIITGLNKTEKVTCLPYDAYRNNFYQSIYRNKGLLIAGYSFGDYYINKMFYRMYQAHGNQSRVVLIDYWNIAQYIKDTEGYENSTIIKDENLRPRYFEHYFEVGGGNVEAMMFVKRVVHRDMDVWEHFNILSMTEPMISDNGQLMLLIGGMKSALQNHTTAIMSFLRS